MPRLRDFILKPARRKPCSVQALNGEQTLGFELRLLSSADTRDVRRAAREYARAQGVADPKTDDVELVRGLWVHTLLHACMDPDSPIDAPVPYFDDVAQIERMLDDARIAFVFQEQQDYQNEYAPQPEGITPEEFPALLGACAREWRDGGDPERPFVGLPSRKLRSFAAQLVLQSTTLTELLSRAGSTTARSSDSTPSSESSAPSSASTG